jgi:hypothetical protein
MLFLYMEVLTCLAYTQHLELLWLENIHVRAFVVHLHSYKPQSGPLLMIKCCISVFHWNSVSIPSDRMVIEVHDYAEISNEILIN